MKKLLTITAALLAAMSMNGQELCTFNPNNSLGLDQDGGTALAAGTIIGETPSMVATIGADDTYKPRFETFSVGDNVISGGLMGSTNPKDADNGVPATTLLPPVSGAFLRFDAKADGFLYLLTVVNSNKAYTVFEEGTAIGYTFAAIGDPKTDLGAVYGYKLKGEGEFNEIKNSPIDWAEREYLKVSAPEKYAAHWVVSGDGTTSWDPIKVVGPGVIKFPVYKDCTYIVNANSSKIVTAGFVFSTTDDVTISSNGVAINNVDYHAKEMTKVGVLKYSYFPDGTEATVVYDESYQQLTEVAIPSTVTINNQTYNVTAIDDKSFQSCWNLTSVTLPKGLESIGNGAFQNTNLQEILFPSTLKSIGERAFEDCHSIKNIVVPEGVERIGSYAFSWMGNLTKLELPKSLKQVGTYLIVGDTRLASMVSHITEPFVISDYTFIYGSSWNSVEQKDELILSPATLYVPVGSQSKYEMAGWSGQFAKVVEGEPQESIVGVLRYSYSSGGTEATVIYDESYQQLAEVTIPATVTIDNKIYSITAIGNGAFQSCWNMTSVTLSEGLVTIGNNAFRYTNIQEILFPSTLKSIGGNAFNNSEGIKTLNVPEGVESVGLYAFSSMDNLTKLVLPASLKDIGNYLIYGDGNLTSVVSRITEPFAISDFAFIDKTQWNTATQKEEGIPSSATLYVPVGTKSKYELAGWASQFAKLVEGEVQESMVDGLRYSYATGGTEASVIQDESYQRMTQLIIPADVQIGNKAYKVTAIGNGAFQNCRNITSVTLPEGVVSIGNNAFQSSNFETVLLPSTLKSIGENAFRYCNNIRNMVIPEGVESIGSYAFYNMGSLTNLELPKSLKRIGTYLIGNDKNLISVVSHSSDPLAVSDYTFVYGSSWNSAEQKDDLIFSPATLYVPVGSQSKYEAAGWTAQFKKVEEGELQESIVGVLRYSYSTGGTEATVVYDESYKQLIEVAIPATVTIDNKEYSVTAIGNCAFWNCGNISSMTLSEGLVAIGNSAFQYSGIQEISLPSTLKSIGECAFEDCHSIKNIVVPEGVESIGDYAFNYMYNLVRLELPKSLKQVGTYLIVGDTRLASMVSHITEPFVISDYTFIYGSSWNSVEQKDELILSPATLYVPVGSQSKYEMAGWSGQFAKVVEGEVKESLVGGLRYSYLPEGSEATVIYDESYQQLAEVTIPATVTIDNKVYNITAIGNGAFQSCWNMTSVTLSEGLVTIGNNAFQSTGLQEILFPSTLKSIGGNAFNNSEGIKTLNVPEGVESVGLYAFSDMDNLTKLVLPASLEDIGDYLICWDRNLTSVVSRITDPFAISDLAFVNGTQWNSATQKNEGVPSSATLYVPVGTKSKYETAGWASQFATVEEGEVLESMVDGLRYSYSTGGTEATVIQDESYKELKEVVIPATVTIDNKVYRVTAVGNRAFQYCWNMTSVTLSEGLVSIGNNAFQNINMQEISFPSTLKSIGDYAFEDCYGIKTIVVPEGVESVGRGAFSWMGDLTRLELPKSLKLLGEYLTNYDGSLISVVSHSTDPFAVLDYTFCRNEWNYSSQKYEQIPSLATLYVPVGTKSLYEAAGWTTQFARVEEGEPQESMVGALKYSYSALGSEATVINDESYQKLTDVVIPATVIINNKSYKVSALGSNAFQYCRNIESVTLSEGLVSIGNNAFRYTGMEGLSFPSTLKSIGENALYGCSNIKTLVVPEGVESIGNSAFNNMGSLTNLELPKSLKRIGSYLIGYDKNLTSVVSHSADPIAVSNYTFVYDSNWNSDTQQQEYTPSPATLYVPKGSKSLYEAAGWAAQFENIEEFDVSVSVTIGSNGKTTLVSTKDLDFTDVEGLKAYIATGYNQDTQEISLTRVLDVPANTPIMLIGEPSGNNPYEVPITTSHTYYPENYLKGSATSASTVDNSGKYVNLALKSGKFQPLTGETFAEGKAYLQLPATIASAKGDAFSFKMGKNGKKMFVGKYDLDFTDVADLKAYIVTGYDKNGTIWMTRVMKTSTGTPLYLVGTANKDFTVPSVATHSSYINMLKGDANNTTALTKEMDGYIVCILKSGKFQPLADDDPAYPAGMSYLPIPKSFIVAASRGNVSNYQFGDVEAEVLKLNLNNGEAMGINRIAAEAGNDTWYNLSGQRISTPTRKGLYIKNGKKIMVK